MYNTCGLLFISFGFTMLKFIACFSRGSSLESECDGMMMINHNGVPEQTNEAPFKIEPENVTVTDSTLANNTFVSLSADPDSFIGFMLDARESDNQKSSGRFTLTGSVSVLICGGRAVAQRNNAAKTRVEVLWTPEKTGEFFFRAAFVKGFQMFWPRKKIPTPTVPPTSEATSTQKIPTTSNIASHATAGTKPPLQCIQYMRCALELLLFSRLCFLGGSSLLMIIRPVSKMATMTASVIELASKTIAAIIILIKLIQYECDSSQIVFTALTVAAMVSSLMHTLTVFLHCGPSHELRKCWLCAVIVVDLTNTIITTTAVFVGILCFQEFWLPLLMGVYVIWEFMLYLGSIWFENMGKYQSRGNLRKNKNILEKKISPWLFTFIIFSVFNVMFTVALMTGVSLVKMKHF